MELTLIQGNFIRFKKAFKNIHDAENAWNTLYGSYPKLLMNRNSEEL